MNKIYRLRFIKNAILILFMILALPAIILAQSASGNALNSDGINDFAYPLTPNAAGFSEGTVEFWFSTDAIYSALWCGGNGLPGVNGDWTRFGTHQTVGGNHLAFGIYAGGWHWASTGVVPDTAKWYHVAATWSSSGIKIYLNGILSGQNGHTGGLHNYATELVAASAWGYEFSGKIDELRIWNIARDSLAIARTIYDTLGAVYYSTADSGLVAYYRMDVFEDLGLNADGTDDLRDLSVNANHLDSEGNPVLIPSGAFSITTSANKPNNYPNKYSLNQNYPNPFNPETTISYNLNKPAFINLSVYDVSGRKIKTLVNEYQKTNSYSYKLNASELAAGVYYYALQIGNEISETKKMILLK